MNDSEFHGIKVEAFKNRMLERVSSGELTPEQVQNMAESSMTVDPNAATSQGYMAAWEELQAHQ